MSWTPNPMVWTHYWPVPKWGVRCWMRNERGYIKTQSRRSQHSTHGGMKDEKIQTPAWCNIQQDVLLDL